MNLLIINFWICKKKKKIINFWNRFLYKICIWSLQNYKFLNLVFIQIYLLLVSICILYELFWKYQFFVKSFQNRDYFYKLQYYKGLKLLLKFYKN